MKKIVSILILMILMFSCKENESKKQNDNINKSDINTEVDSNQDNFNIEMNVIVEKPDEFVLYYLEGEQNKIKQRTSISLKVVGSTEPQKLKFKLKDNVLPTKLFLKFGQNQAEQKITFFKTIISYRKDEKKLVIEGSRFFQFFNPNEFIDFDKVNNIATLKEINGKMNPAFVSRKVLDRKIDFMY